MKQKFIFWLAKFLGVKIRRCLTNEEFALLPKVDIEATPTYVPKNQRPTFSGIDTQIIFEFADGTEMQMRNVQSITINNNLQDNNGTFCIESLLFEEDLISKISKDVYSIIIDARDEYGRRAVSKLEDIQFNNCRWGVSFDDIVVQITHTGTAHRIQSWTELKVKD